MSTREEIDEFFAERWRVLTAMLEAERSLDERQEEPAQLELGRAA